jgi:hypothetical protein
MIEVKDALEQSIKRRKQEQIDLGEHEPHRDRIRQEEDFLRQLEKKINGT